MPETRIQRWIDASASSSRPKRRATTGRCSSSYTALAGKRDGASASAASSAPATGFASLRGRPVIA
jgi:hypothetical protein